MAKKKILVIDDEPNIVQVIKGRMEAANYDVIGAYNGLEGLKKAREEKPDVIILDIVMPGMDGFQVCKKLKKDKETKRIPIIILTASGAEDVARDEPEIEAEAYLAKPYSPEELVNAVQDAIQRQLKR